MQSKIVDVSGRPISEVAVTGPVVEIVRSFSFKKNLGNYQSCDFFVSQKASCAAEDRDEVSSDLFEWCMDEVMKSVADIERRMEEKKEGGIVAIVAKAGASFEVCPAGGFAAVCCDIVDMGIVKTNYSGKEKKQHKIRIGWQVEEFNEAGKPFIVWKRYTLSLHEKAALRKDLESWRGRPFTEDELQGWDVEAVLGVPAMINVVQNAVNGSVYANVTAIMRLPKGMNAPTVTPGYVRFQDRPTEGAPAGDGPEHDFGPDLSDVPF